MLNFLDLFAGAGGLSEGFIQAGYNPIAHIEMDEAACFTLKTRAAYHWLKTNNMLSIYNSYLCGNMSRQAFYKTVPKDVLDSVIQEEISEESLLSIFAKIDRLRCGNPIDIIIGGPPCQAYSLIGRARSITGMIGDQRNYLYRYYAEFLKYYKPKLFVFENVIGLLSAKEEDGSKHFDHMRKLFQKCGYSTEFNVLNAHDYGVLQNRKRIILIGKAGKSEQGFYPQLPLTEDEGITVSEIFKDLPVLHAGEGTYRPQKTLPYSGKYLYNMGIKDCDMVTFHVARPNTNQDLMIYHIAVASWNNNHKRLNYNQLPANLQTHHNRTSFVDRFKVVAGDLPFSQTVVAHISRDGHYFIHPDINQNRSLTPREVARLQTFPDSYYFESYKDKPGRTAAYRQIGNAVPVRLAFVIATALKKQTIR